MRTKIHLLGLLLSTTVLFADPPEPEVGKRWIINVEYSDEFNGNSLDESKWKKSFRGWNGRRPASFEPSTISVKNGNMQIRNQPGSPRAGYSISGGAVQSKNLTASFGYYECNFRASRINMSTTFWLDNFNEDVPFSKLGNCPNDNYSQELDICESIGGVINGGAGFRKTMKFNTHVRYKGCNGGERKFYSRGNNEVEIRDGDLQGGDATLVGGGESWENFHTYGSYWKNAEEATFFVDNKFIGLVKFRTDVFDEPFRHPMGVNMVTETYTWALPYPTVAQLNNDAINTSYYNWVRSYKKIDIEASNPYASNSNNIPSGDLVTNGDFEKGNFEGWTGFGTTALVTNNTYNNSGFAVKVNGANGGREYAVTLKPNTDYTLSAQVKVSTGTVALGIKGIAGEALGATNLTNSNYQKATVTFNSGNITKAKFFFFVANAGDEAFGDNFELKETNPGVTANPPSSEITGTYAPIFNESIAFFQQPKFKNGNTKVEISYLYKANIDREFRLHIFDSGNNEVFETDFLVLEGYGKNIKTIDLPNTLTGTVSDYTFLGEIREVGKGTNSIIDATGDTSVLSVFSVVQNSLKAIIYPNPAKNNVNIKIPNAKGLIEVELYNPEGKLLISTNYESTLNSFETEYLPEGIYFLKIRNGNKVSNKKLIIAR